MNKLQLVGAGTARTNRRLPSPKLKEGDNEKVMKRRFEINQRVEILYPFALSKTGTIIAIETKYRVKGDDGLVFICNDEQILPLPLNKGERV